MSSHSTSMSRFLYQRQLTGNRRLGRIPVPSRYLEGFECSDFDEISTRDNFQLAETPPLTCQFTKWIKNGMLMAVADERGMVELYDTRRPLGQASDGSWEAHNNAVFDLAWMPVDNEAKLLTASGDQKIRLWDCSNTQSPLATFNGHTGSVKSVSFCAEEPMLFASGARDGHIMLWDLRVNRSPASPPYQIRPCSQLLNAHSTLGMAASSGAHTPRRHNRAPAAETAGRQSVTAVVFRDDRCIVSAGGGDSMIKVWDIRMPRSIHKAEPTPATTFAYCGERQGKQGFTGLVMDPTKATVYASCTDSVVYQYDITACTPRPVSSIQASGIGSYFVKMDLSPDGEFLITGSTDNDAMVYQVRHPDQAPVALSGHVGEVMGVAFCPGQQDQIATCSDDCTVRLWRRKGTSQFNRSQCGGQQVGSARLLPAPERKKTPAEVAAAAGRDSTQVTPSKCMRTSTLLSFVTVTPTSRTVLFGEQDNKENVDNSGNTVTATTSAMTIPAIRSTVESSDDCPQAKRVCTHPASSSNRQIVLSTAAASNPTPADGASTRVVSPRTPTTPTLPYPVATPSSSSSSQFVARSKTTPSGRGRTACKSGTAKLTPLQQWLCPQPSPSRTAHSPTGSNSDRPDSTNTGGSASSTTPTRSVSRRLSITHVDKGGLVCAAPDAGTSVSPSASCRQTMLSPASPAAEPPAMGGRMATAE